MKNCMVYVDVFFLASGSVLHSRSIYLWEVNFVPLTKPFYVGLELFYSKITENKNTRIGTWGHPGIVVMKRNLRYKVWTSMLKGSAVHVMDFSIQCTNETRTDAQNLVTMCTVGAPSSRFSTSITFWRFIVCSCWLLVLIQVCLNDEVHNRRKNFKLFQEDLKRLWIAIIYYNY